MAWWPNRGAGGGISIRAVALLALVASCPAPRVGGELAVEARAIVVDAAAPARTRFGRATLLAALELRSADARFGGLSGLCPLSPRRLLAVSDRGQLFELGLRLGRDGRLLGIASAAARALRRPAPIAAIDAEAIARDRDGSLLVAVEQLHGLWRYRTPASAPEPVALPAELRAAPANGGLEAMTVLADGRLLLLCERCAAREGPLRGWIGGPRAWRPLAVRAGDGFVPTDLAPLPDGGALLLERDYSRARGARARVRRLAAAALRDPRGPLDGEELLRLERPLAVDNFEGLAAGQAGGRPSWLMISDDNFDRRGQRTLLLQFGF